MSDNSQMAGDTVDTKALLESESGKLYIDAGPLCVGFADGVRGGVRLIQDGSFCALAQGIDYEDGDRATVSNDLTADQCRELAAALEQAADDMERAPERADSDTDSLLDRAMEAMFA